MQGKIQRFLVSGRVQGVYFRASTREQAVRLGLVGYARNLSDGRVEVVAAGDEANLAILAIWLQRGPPAAMVTDVTVLEPPELEASFLSAFVTR